MYLCVCFLSECFGNESLKFPKKNIQSTDYQSSREALLKMDLSAQTGVMCVRAVCACVYWPRLRKLLPMHLMSKSKLMVLWVTMRGKCFFYCWSDRRMILSTATKQGGWVCHQKNEHTGQSYWHYIKDTRAEAAQQVPTCTESVSERLSRSGFRFACYSHQLDKSWHLPRSMWKYIDRSGH